MDDDDQVFTISNRSNIFCSIIRRCRFNYVPYFDTKSQDIKSNYAQLKKETGINLSHFVQELNQTMIDMNKYAFRKIMIRLAILVLFTLWSMIEIVLKYAFNTMGIFFYISKLMGEESIIGFYGIVGSILFIFYIQSLNIKKVEYLESLETLVSVLDEHNQSKTWVENQLSLTLQATSSRVHMYNECEKEEVYTYIHDIRVQYNSIKDDHLKHTVVPLQTFDLPVWPTGPGW